MLTNAVSRPNCAVTCKFEAPIDFKTPISFTRCRTTRPTEKRMTAPLATNAAIMPISLLLSASEIGPLIASKAESCVLTSTTSSPSIARMSSATCPTWSTLSACTTT